MPLRDVSFDTISGAGPNGAIMHYRVIARAPTASSQAGELFLLDSGAQYQDGTTDITRTVAVGAAEPRRCASASRCVLKGMIGDRHAALSRRHARRRRSTRSRAWRCGRPGSTTTTAPATASAPILSVHEGPQRIAKTGTERCSAGMIISNEPGYYKEGAYGIRIENLILVEPAEPIPGGDIADATASRR